MPKCSCPFGAPSSPQLEEAQELTNSAKMVAADAAGQVNKLDKEVKSLQAELLAANRSMAAAQAAAAQAPQAAPAPAAPAVDTASLARIVDLEKALSDLKSELAQAKAREEASHILTKASSTSSGVAMGAFPCGRPPGRPFDDSSEVTQAQRACTYSQTSSALRNFSQRSSTPSRRPTPCLKSGWYALRVDLSPPSLNFLVLCSPRFLATLALRWLSVLFVTHTRLSPPRLSRGIVPACLRRRRRRRRRASLRPCPPRKRRQQTGWPKLPLCGYADPPTHPPCLPKPRFTPAPHSAPFD